jgi:CheY-like chemotaxis protein/two-component sensor histidine kinase
MHVADVLRETMAALEPAARARGVDLVLDAAAPALGEPVLGDATRLRQILANLVHNAIKFTDRGGRVKLVADASAQAGNLHLACTVEDNGIGIEPDQLRRVFEPFEQADRSTTRRFGGTGLGLAIVRRLLDLMHGTIEVDSQPGQGSRFRVHVTFPLAEAEVAHANPTATTQARDLSRLRVLVAEDNPTNQIVEQALLQSLGIVRVTVAENGQEAVDIALREPQDLILMDCFMPVMDGYEATRVLRRSGVKVPIIALTANVLPEDRAALFDAGMVDCVPKPIDLEQLRRVIERYVVDARETSG